MLVAAQLARNGSGASPGGGLVGGPAPAIAGSTLDGTAFDLAAYRGHPVVVNFWGPSCVPCRDEFPLFKAKLEQYRASGLVVVGVLAWDAVEPATAFVADMGATWPTVVDPDGAIRTAYRVVGRPQTYFIDATGTVVDIQIGQTTAATFDRMFADIAATQAP